MSYVFKIFLRSSIDFANDTAVTILDCFLANSESRYEDLEHIKTNPNQQGNFWGHLVLFANSSMVKSVI